MNATDISLMSIQLQEMAKITDHLQGAVVFVDDGFTDVLHWLGGAELLLQYGVVAIKQFSSFEGGLEDEHKSVMFISTAFQQDEEITVKDIIDNSNFNTVFIITNIHPAIQAIIRFRPVNDEEVTEIMEKIERNVGSWIKAKTGSEGTAAVVYAPLRYSAILPSNLFVLPSHSSFFPLTPYELRLLHLRSKVPHSPTEVPKVGFEHLPKEMQLQYKLLVSSLNGVCESFEVDEEIFSIGASSCIIADELSTLSWKDNRKPSKRKASLLLIDRTLDLSTPSHHSFHSIFDQIFSTLPPTQHHDVLIDLAPIYSPLEDLDIPDLQNDEDLHGSLCHGGDNSSASLLKSLTLLKHKEIVNLLNWNLTSLLKKHNMAPSNVKGVEGLLKNTSLLKDNDEVIRKNSVFIQLLLAFSQASNCQRQKSFSKLQRIEKLVLHCVGGDDDSACVALRAFDEFCRLKIEEPDTSYSLDDLLTLLLHVFAIFEVTMTSSEQDTLEERLVEEMEEANKRGEKNGLLSWDDCGGSKANCRLVVQEIFTQLKCLSHARLHLTNYKSVLSKSTPEHPSNHQPLIKQVLNDITDPSNPLSDLKERGSGLGGMLKGSFGFFKASSQPLDHPVLIIFFLGGVSLSEVKMVVDHFAGKKQPRQVIVGGTTILTPHKTTQLTLFNPHSCLL